MLKKRKLLTIRSLVTMAVVVMIFSAGVASSQNYPNKPIHFIVPEPGGPLDTIARLLGPGIAGLLNQPVIIDNRGSSALTPEILARAAPDGYTVGFCGGTLWLTPLFEKTSYDAERDFSPITIIGKWPFLLSAHPSLPVNSVKDLIALAKANPGALNIGASASPGGASFLGAELLKTMAGINMVRVPYKGNTSALTDLLAGEVQLLFIDIHAGSPHIKSGRLKALAVSSLQPSPLAPGLPTISATGVPGYELESLVGLFAPAATPAPIVNRLNQEFVRQLSRTDVKEKFYSIGIDIVTSSPEEFAAVIKSDRAKWGKVLKDAGIKLER